MAQLLASEPTSFTLDNMGRFLCNTLEEALDSAAQTVAGRQRGFDVILSAAERSVPVIAEHFFVADATHSRRIIVLEAGPFVLPEHVQNLPYMGGAPKCARRGSTIPPSATRASSSPWADARSLGAAGRPNCWIWKWPHGRRRPAMQRPALTGEYFAEASRQIGVKETNDFIYGPLHIALRKQLHAGLKPPAMGPDLPLPNSSTILRCATRIRGNRRSALLCFATGWDCHRPIRRQRLNCASCSSSKHPSRCSPRPCRVFSRRTNSAPSRD